MFWPITFLLLASILCCQITFLPYFSCLHFIYTKIYVNFAGTEESMEDKSRRSRNGKIDDRLTKDSKVCVHEEQAFMEVDASMLSKPGLQDPPNDNDLRDYCHDTLVDAEGSQPGECQSNHSIMSFYGSNSLTRSSNPVFKIDIKGEYLIICSSLTSCFS